MIVLYLPRFYYLCKLYGWCCCGKKNDTSQDRHGVVKGLWGFVISAGLTFLAILILILALGGGF